MGNRKFIRDGRVTVNNNNKTQVFVFSDMVLLTTPQKLKNKMRFDKRGKVEGSDKKCEYKYRCAIPLKGAKLSIPSVPAGTYLAERTSNQQIQHATF